MDRSTAAEQPQDEEERSLKLLKSELDVVVQVTVFSPKLVRFVLHFLIVYEADLEGEQLNYAGVEQQLLVVVEVKLQQR